MTLTPDQRIAAIGVSIAVLLPAFPALWKAAALRGDTNSRWATRVDLAYVGLTERAVEALRELQAHADSLLGGVSGFDPTLVVADPAPLADLAGRFSRLLKIRKHLRKRFRRQLTLTGLTIYLVGLYALGVIIGGVYYDGFEAVSWTGTAGIVCVSIALGAGGLLLIEYSYLERKLSTAEILGASTTTPGD